MFSYIVNVYNSEGHLSRVLAALFGCKSKESKVYVILDGCTDGSKEIAETYDVNIIETPDVRETLAINEALKQVPQVGYNFILQDDVILQDMDIESKILSAYQAVPNLGVLSLRHGSNFMPDALTNDMAVPFRHTVQSEHQPYLDKVPLLKDGHLTFRHVVYKSPIVISSDVVEKLGGYDERLAPIAHDDTEYCIRAYKAGYRNAVYAVPVMQPMMWGGTRRHSKQPKDLHQEHMDLLRTLYPEEIAHLQANPESLDMIQI